MSDVRKMISGSLKNIERKLVSDHGVHLLLPPPSPLSAAWDGGGGVEPPTKFSKRELDRISIFRGGRQGDLFLGGGVVLQFLHNM